MFQENRIPKNAKKVFAGIIFDTYQWKQKVFDGSTKTFECVERPDIAVIIATVGKNIILQKQRQPHWRKSYLSLPSGRCEKNEKAIKTAKRELLEESGFISDDWKLWMKKNLSEKVKCTTYYYIARNCKKIQEQKLDWGEKIETIFISFHEFLLLSEDETLRDFGLVPELYKMRLYKKEREKIKKLFFQRKK